MKTAIIEGQYRLDAKLQQWAMPGWSGRYWDVITCEDEDDLTAYLAGQQPYIPHSEEFPHVPYGQEARNERRTPPPHVCARCHQPCKPQFRYCYRCNCYLKVKAKIA